MRLVSREPNNRLHQVYVPPTSVVGNHDPNGKEIASDCLLNSDMPRGKNRRRITDHVSNTGFTLTP